MDMCIRNALTFHIIWKTAKKKNYVISYVAVVVGFHFAFALQSRKLNQLFYHNDHIGIRLMGYWSLNTISLRLIVITAMIVGQLTTEAVGGR